MLLQQQIEIIRPMSGDYKSAKRFIKELTYDVWYKVEDIPYEIRYEVIKLLDENFFEYIGSTFDINFQMFYITRLTFEDIEKRKQNMNYVNEDNNQNK